MKIGVFLFAGVEMDNVGPGPPDPTERRYEPHEVWHATEQIMDVGVLADRLGFEFFMFTEHHFQHEGYEVIPNSILLGSVLAERTEQIHIGAMFNIVPLWHPVRLAEDFATFVNLSGGRAILGVGRGTVQRESVPFGSSIASIEDPEGSAEADRRNREAFVEAMEVVRLALDSDRFSYHGDHFDLPPPGIADRGSIVQDLTLIPRPLHPYEIWQPVTSPQTLEYVPRQGFHGVFWHANHALVDANWARFGDVYEQAHGRELGPGEGRVLVVDVFIGDTREEALAGARPSHDEYWKFLVPYGRTAGYRDPDGNPYPSDFVPTLEQSIEQGAWMIGTPEQVAEGINSRIEALGGVEKLAVFPVCLSLSYDVYHEQVTRFAEEVRPLLRE
ncbi:MAG: LLM class flavin-dependent oxidoreductase [Actinomycetota bacterium]|nr:LLM class flavin-dependent oxidoreductase [Actinomycetota bacterium]